MWPLVLQPKHVAKSLFLFSPPLSPSSLTGNKDDDDVVACDGLICPFVHSPPPENGRRRRRPHFRGKSVIGQRFFPPFPSLTHTRERKNRLFFLGIERKRKASSPFSSSPSILLRLPPLSLPESVVVGGRISPPFLSPSPFA